MNHGKYVAIIQVVKKLISTYIDDQKDPFVFPDSFYVYSLFSYYPVFISVNLTYNSEIIC